MSPSRWPRQGRRQKVLQVFIALDAAARLPSCQERKPAVRANAGDAVRTFRAGECVARKRSIPMLADAVAADRTIGDDTFAPWAACRPNGNTLPYSLG